MFEPKLPVIAAAVGFVLSFLVGLFSGAAFPAFLLRALGMALFFAAVVALLHIVVRKFLPELLDGAETAPVHGATQDTGTRVDLTIDDDDVLSESPYVSTGKEKELSPDQDEMDELQYDETVLYPDEASVEPERETGPAAPLPTSGTGSGTEPDKQEYKPKLKGGVSGLDILPDIQDFVPEEKVVEEDAADFDDSIVVQSSGKGFSVPDVGTDGVETDTMAKAIRTILSRDK